MKTVIEMAREARIGLGDYGNPEGRAEFFRRLEHYTALVREDERESNILYRQGFSDGKSLIEAAVLDEREACAKVCEELVLDHPARADLTANQCAAAIRARGE